MAGTVAIRRPIVSRHAGPAEGRTAAHRHVDYHVNFLVAKDGNQYAALCYEYNVATCAKTVQAAIEDLAEATVAYLEIFLEHGKEPEPRPADRELLLEFLGLDPKSRSFPKDDLEKVLMSVYGGSARLRAPLIYSLKQRRFTTPLGEALRSPRTGSYPIAICYA
jgi:predicted RNase H-like HicB family nuclease